MKKLKKSEEEKEFEEKLAEVNAHPQVSALKEGKRVVTLSEPFTFISKEISTITFRKPKGKDWRAMDAEEGDIGKAYCLAAALSGQDISVFDEMGGEDALLCVLVASVMGKKSKTGGT